jgi:hypothetical protein
MQTESCVRGNHVLEEFLDIQYWVNAAELLPFTRLGRAMDADADLARTLYEIAVDRSICPILTSRPVSVFALFGRRRSATSLNDQAVRCRSGSIG